MRRLLSVAVALTLYGGAALAQPALNYNFVRDNEGRPVFGIGARPVVTGNMGVPNGTPFFDTTDNQLYYWSGTAWTAATAVDTGLADPGGDGITVRTAEDVTAARSITSPAGTLAITNADGVAGNIGLDVDTSIYGQFSSGTSTVSGNCTLGDTYLETDANLWSMCTATNTWRTAVTFSETATTGMGFVIDEDSFASDSATKVPTQQSVKAYAVGIPTTSTAGFGFVIDDDSMATASATKLATSESIKAYVDTAVAGAGGSFNPLTTVSYVEEFNGGTATTGQRGVTGYVWAAVSTGTQENWDTGTASHPGWTQWVSGATDNSGNQAVFGRGVGTTSSETQTLPAGVVDDNVWSVGFLFKASRVDSQSFNFGLFDVGPLVGATYGIGVRLELDHTDTNWMFVTCNAAGAAGCGAAGDDTNQKVIDSGVVAAINTWYYLKIRHSIDDKIYMSINGGAESSFCASGCTDTAAGVPTGQDLGVRAYVINRAGSASSTVDLDMVHYDVTGLTRY